jgi:hypothetical protein
LVFLFMASVPSRALIKQRDEMDLFGFWGRTYCLVFDLRLLFFLISCIGMNPFVYVFFLECVVGIVDQIHKGEPTVIVRTLLYLHLWALVHTFLLSSLILFFNAEHKDSRPLLKRAGWKKRGGGPPVIWFFFFPLRSCNCYLYLQRYLLPSFPNTIMATYTREGSLRYIQGPRS